MVLVSGSGGTREGDNLDASVALSDHPWDDVCRGSID